MLKILIVEDEDIIRKGLAYTIDWLSMGYVIAGEAANGQEGYDKILELKPDVVIADIKMPKKNGIDMIREAMQQVEFKSILLTSYAEFDYAKQAIDLKVYEYLLKPVDEDRLTEIMKKLQAEIVKCKEFNRAIENKNGKLDIEYFMSLDHTENQYIAKAIEEIRMNYREKISIESVSEEYGVSASYLSRRFKEITGLTFLDFLNKYRVQKAVKLLNQGEYRIYEISEMTGFTDYKHFCAVFKRYTLSSPTGFVKKRE